MLGDSFPRGGNETEKTRNLGAEKERTAAISARDQDEADSPADGVDADLGWIRHFALVVFQSKTHNG